MKKGMLASGISLALLTSHVYAQNFITTTVDDNIVHAGDIIQIALPATGLFAAWLYDDWEGAKQQVYTLGSSVAMVGAGKFVVGRTRPNKSNQASFPSGHTTAAFSGASFLYNRYGAAWGLPAYAAATFVGASRIHGNRHYADDVLAGAGIAFLNSRYWVTEFDPNGVNVSASPTEDGVEVSVSIDNSALDYDNSSRRQYSAYDYDFKHSFTLNIGFNTRDTLRDIDNNPTLAGSEPLDPNQPFSSALYEYFLTEDSSIEVGLNPNETRREAEVEGTLIVDDTVYNDDELVFASLRQWSLGASYLKHWKPVDNLHLAAGAGLYAYYVELQTDLQDGGRYESVKDFPFLPSVTGKVDYFFTPKWSVSARADFQYFDDSVFYSELATHYHITPAWQVGLKYGYSNSRWQDSDISYRSDTIMIGVTNRF